MRTGDFFIPNFRRPFNNETADENSPMAYLSIRLATANDLAAINSIYNHYVLRSTCTYQTEPSTERERAEWFDAHGGNYPVTVGEREGKVVSWASISPFHRRAAYRPTVENSVYV